MIKQIGSFTEEIIRLLKIDVAPGTPIFIGDTNIEHIKKRHPLEYEMYFPHIEEIIAAPDFVGQSPSDQSIAFVKIFQLGNEYIRVAVKINPNGRAYVKTLHLLSTCNAERYIEKGTYKKVP